MTVRSHGATHVGLVRDHNEDAFFTGDWVLAVADGVGGAPAGEVASAMAIREIAAVDRQRPEGTDDAAAELASAVHRAASRIHHDAVAEPSRAGMATTLTAAGLWDGRLVLAHVGDSRAYLLRDGRLEQRTRDHTVVEEAVRSGVLDRAEAARHPRRHMLLRALGSGPDVDVAVPEPVDLLPGDQVLLCSDGLTEACDEDRIASLLAAARDPADAGSRLVDAALEGGAPDNVTVVVAWYE